MTGWELVDQVMALYGSEAVVWACWHDRQGKTCGKDIKFAPCYRLEDDTPAPGAGGSRCGLLGSSWGFMRAKDAHAFRHGIEYWNNAAAYFPRGLYPFSGWFVQPWPEPIEEEAAP